MKNTTGRELSAPSCTPMRTFFRRLCDSPDRIKLLHIWSAHYIQTRIWELLNHPLPLLHSLHLDLSLQNFERGTEFTNSLPIIMGGQTSNLKRLSLCNICLWSLNTFSQLTHLSLRNQDDRLRPSLPQFLNSLADLPLLEVLCLRSAGPILTLPQAITPPRRTINLLELRRVELGCVHQPEIEAPCYILHYFNMPADVVIIICSPAMFRSAVIFRHHLPPPSYMSKITSFDLRMTAGQYLMLDKSHITINNSIPLESCFLLMSTLKNITTITLNRTYRLPNNQFGRTVLPTFPALQTFQIKVPSDYIPIIDALQRGSQAPQFARLIVCDVGSDLSAYKPASRIQLMPHREAGTTVISRRGMGKSYQVIVQPYVEAALPVKRRLLCER